MKKILLLSLMGGFVLNVSAQSNGHTLKPLQNKSYPKISKFNIDSKGTGTQAAAPAPSSSGGQRGGYVGVKVGETIYDLQTNSSMPRRIINYGNGKVSLAWTIATDGDPWPSRGTGYNHYDGTAWKFLADVANRIETARTGFPGIVSLSNGHEVTLAHLATPFDFRKSENTTPGGAFTDISVDASIVGPGSPASEQTLWCRVAAGGPDGMSIHMISSYGDSLVIIDGVKQPVTYSRSLDGGVTWDKKSILLPGYDSSRYERGGGEDYAIEVNGSTVAVLMGGLGDDMALWKSTDNGDSFVKSYIQKMPYPSKNIMSAPVDSTMDTNDGSMSLTVDNTGKVRVVWALSGVENDGPDGGTSSGSVFLPGSIGLMYWEDATDSVIKIFNLANPANFSSFDTATFLAFDITDDGAISVGVNSTNATVGTGGPAAARYGNNSILHKPSLSMNAAADTLYITFSMITDDDTTGDGQGFRDIFVMGSVDNGMTWTVPINVTQTVGFEEAFPSAATLVNGNIHIVYQEDFEPGTELTNADPANQTNDIKYLKVPIGAIWNGDVGYKETLMNEIGLANYPNPFTGATTIVVNLGKQSNIDFSVTNMFGEVVAANNYSNVNGQLKINFNAGELASGVYFYTVKTDNNSVTRKMMIQK